MLGGFKAQGKTSWKLRGCPLGDDTPNLPGWGLFGKVLHEA